jgi:uncharacterized protein (DUF2252 family)
LAAQNQTREPDLVPVRHGRMMVSPFTFYRGAATVMAADLKHIPRAGLTVQLCGDAHLLNFGLFASPERTLLFDVDDFDETLPGPFEYDIARLSASFVVAARDNGFPDSVCRAAGAAPASAYRRAMASFATMGALEVWYSRLDAAPMLERGAPAAREALTKARSRNSLQALPKLTEVVDGKRRIRSDPPVLVPNRELVEGAEFATELNDALRTLLRAYRSTLDPDRRVLLEQFEFVDAARKVVGVGSVGTRAWVVLLLGRDGQDPLFLQVKEATRSVLEDHLPKSRYRQPGARVVNGQRLMQAASDIFLGWSKGVDANRHYYWRQLRDMKGSADISRFSVDALTHYADACGWTLARAHARSGDAVAISAYLGKGDRFDRAMGAFAVRYADQNERDYQNFVAAIQCGKLNAIQGM